MYPTIDPFVQMLFISCGYQTSLVYHTWLSYFVSLASFMYDRLFRWSWHLKAEQLSQINEAVDYLSCLVFSDEAQ